MTTLLGVHIRWGLSIGDKPGEPEGGEVTFMVDDLRTKDGPQRHTASFIHLPPEVAEELSVLLKAIPGVKSVTVGVQDFTYEIDIEAVPRKGRLDKTIARAIRAVVIAEALKYVGDLFNLPWDEIIGKRLKSRAKSDPKATPAPEA